MEFHEMKYERLSYVKYVKHQYLIYITSMFIYGTTKIRMIISS